VWGQVRVHIFNRPISNDVKYSLGIKNECTPRAVVRLVNIFNCIAYGWTIKKNERHLICPLLFLGTCFIQKIYAPPLFLNLVRKRRGHIFFE
jgi:hypothetical protein